MKTYLIRSIKYLIWLALLFTLIFVLMIRTNTCLLYTSTQNSLFGRGQRMYGRH